MPGDTNGRTPALGVPILEEVVVPRETRAIAKTPAKGLPTVGEQLGDVVGEVFDRAVGTGKGKKGPQSGGRLIAAVVVAFLGGGGMTALGTQAAAIWGLPSEVEVLKRDNRAIVDQLDQITTALGAPRAESFDALLKRKKKETGESEE